MNTRQTLAGGGGRVRGAQDHMRVSFAAFVEDHQVTWLKYAHVHVGGRQAAEEVVDEMVTQLYEQWPRVLARDSVERYAVRILKACVVRWLGEHDAQAAFVETSAFQRAMRESRRRFDILEESLGLYSAIAALPERQYTVIVLRYVLGHTDERIAALLGVAPATVRSHAALAKRRLARHLGMAGES